jgi:NADH-quinone oxidoreductase subunit H
MNPGEHTQRLWTQQWCSALGIFESMPAWFYFLLALIFTYCLIMIPSGAILTYFDRKLSADFQARVGPNQAGPVGIFQPIADFFKLLQKQSSEKPNWKEDVWLSVHTMALYSTLAVMPLGTFALMLDTEMSALLPFWSALVLALGTMLLGFVQGTVPGWFGGIRIAAQTLAGSFPALMALLCAGVRAGSFKWSELATSQGFSPLSWTVFSNPFQTIAFLVFIMSGLVISATPPLDGGLSMSDIHGGVSSQLYGRKYSLYRFGRFYVFFLWSVITVVLFLGAWILPARLSEWLIEESDFRLLSCLELTWLLGKTFIVMLLIIWIARVNPRSRVDQITSLAWKVLSPFSLIALVGASLWIGWRNLI